METGLSALKSGRRESDLVKAIVYFAQHPMAGVVVGAKAPLILPSRSDTFESKLDSLALGVVMA